MQKKEPQLLEAENEHQEFSQGPRALHADSLNVAHSKINRAISDYMVLQKIRNSIVNGMSETHLQHV